MRFLLLKVNPQASSLKIGLTINIKHVVEDVTEVENVVFLTTVSIVSY